jgi:hypothetical protein
VQSGLRLCLVQRAAQYSPVGISFRLAAAGRALRAVRGDGLSSTGAPAGTPRRTKPTSSVRRPAGQHCVSTWWCADQGPRRETMVRPGEAGGEADSPGCGTPDSSGSLPGLRPLAARRARFRRSPPPARPPSRPAVGWKLLGGFCERLESPRLCLCLWPSTRTTHHAGTHGTAGGRCP